MNLSRTRHGTMIHKRDCRFAANGAPWRWAEDYSPIVVKATCDYFGYQTCLACKPLPDSKIRPIDAKHQEAPRRRVR